MRRLLVVLIALLVAACASAPVDKSTAHPRVVANTDAGSFTIELRPDLAPRHVARFLRWAEGRGGESGLEGYEGSGVCEARGGAFLVLGCFAPENPFARPGPRGNAERLSEEVDRIALGLADKRITEFKDVDYLWQREVFPRAINLEERGREVPPKLAEWVAEVRVRGDDAVPLLENISWHDYLGGMGYAHQVGASAIPLERGALAAASYWPGESDERFMIALVPVSEREGRVTVFGRVVEGLELIEEIAARPVNRVRVPKENLSIESMESIGR